MEEMLAKLTQAEELIGEVIPRLNTERAACPCCGLNKHADYPQFQAFKSLEGVLTRLRYAKWSMQGQKKE